MYLPVNGRPIHLVLVKPPDSCLLPKGHYILMGSENTQCTIGKKPSGKMGYID